MIYKKYFLIFMLLSGCSFSPPKDATIFSTEKIKKTKNEDGSFLYVIDDFEKPKCYEKNNCSLFLGEVGDSFKILVNEEVVLDTLNIYKKFESHIVVLPSSILKERNSFEIITKDLNGSLDGLRSKNIFISNYNDVLNFSKTDWWKRTGVIYTSIYVLFLIGLFSLFVMFIQFEKNLLSIFSYAVVSAVYLFSFSETPREFGFSEVLSGGVHFPLRLTQDLFLVLLFKYNLSGTSQKGMYGIYLVYSIAILSMMLPLLFGVINYSYHLKVIQIAAPLVAFPMGFGLFLSIKNIDPFERKVLIPVSALLFAFQVNDLLVFWQVYQGYFTVKFYIPFILGLLIFISIYRKVKEFQKQKIQNEKSKIAMQMAHDIRSPVMALRVIKDRVKFDHEEIQLLENAIDRINNIANSILPEKRVWFNITQLINELVKQYSLTHPGVILKFSKRSDLMVLSRPSLLSRVIMNLINNSIESSLKPCIEIFLENQSKDFVEIIISDNGSGIPENVLSQIGKKFVSKGKMTGFGLGLRSMYKYIQEEGGKYLINTGSSGTRITLQVPVSNQKMGVL